MFVIGTFDTRITFYTQQVRALLLAHALRDQGILHDGLRIAVVGGGAAGVTAAAAVALLAQVNVTLYERAEDVLPLQRATMRRRLDPHIYGWPEVGSDDPVAALPLLDWKSGPARSVREDVKGEFDAIVHAANPRLRVCTRHNIVAARALGNGIQLDFRRDAKVGDVPDAVDGQVSGQAAFDLLLLAFGFGLEPDLAMPGVPSASYWDEAGIPVAEFQGRPTPRFLISGNGDGGLIDLVAAASVDFDHASTIQEIVRQPGIEQTIPALAAIDQQALIAFQNGVGFDFLAAYDAQLRVGLQGLGLFDLVAGRLRPGVRITLQTLKPEAFSIETATLNRLAAYLVIRSLEAGAQTDFVHVHTSPLVPVAMPHGAAYAAPLWFTCAGLLFGVDRAIIRRGPQRAAARAPFADLLTGYQATHAAWHKLHGAEARVPKLSGPARDAFRNVADANHLPLPIHVQRELQHRRATVLRAQAEAAGVRWSGDLAPEGVGELWDADGNTADILVPSAPHALADVASAVVRLALHAHRATLLGDPGDWKAFSDPLTSSSPHATHLASLRVRPNPAGGTQNPQSRTAADVASALHLAMNQWVLQAVHANLQTFTTTGRDPAHVVGFKAAADLRARMRHIWEGWRTQFVADSILLDRFLRLTICAEDDDAGQDEARVIVGPYKLPHITRAIAASLAIAAAWPDTTPKGARPGNLSRTLAAVASWHGHTCAADLICHEPTAIAATKYMWRTHFVVLSQMDTPLSIVALAQSGFAEVDEQQPSLAEPGSGGLFLTLDASFRTAAEAGLGALIAFLGEVETQHFTRLSAAVVQE